MRALVLASATLASRARSLTTIIVPAVFHPLRLFEIFDRCSQREPARARRKLTKLTRFLSQDVVFVTFGRRKRCRAYFRRREGKRRVLLPADSPYRALT